MGPQEVVLKVSSLSWSPLLSPGIRSNFLLASADSPIGFLVPSAALLWPIAATIQTIPMGPSGLPFWSLEPVFVHFQELDLMVALISWREV